MRKQTSQSGAAIIMAMLVVAIVATIATTIMFSQRVDINRQILIEQSDNAHLEAQYAAQWTQYQMQQLNIALTQQQQRPAWPQVMPTKTLENGDVINATFTAANARFNINNLALGASQYYNTFTQLIMAVAPQMSKTDAQQITQNVQAWLLPAAQSGTQGQSSNDVYSKMRPPYQAAHQKMASASELRLVAGVTRDLYTKLRPYIIALPETDIKIDINSAPKQILMALLNDDPSAAEQVIQYRRSNNGFTDSSQFLGLSQVTGYAQNINGKPSALSQIITTKMPAYLLLQTSVKSDKMTFHIDSIIQYDSTNKSMQVLQQGQSL